MRRLPLRSPPRVRGKVCHTMAEAKGLGITPAYAGKRDLVISGSGDIEDHPRVCGEKSTSEAQKSSDMGSPPRMRGKVYKITPPWFSIRITPAYAGKSMGEGFLQARKGDHPRVCGEKPFLFYGGSSDSGSSPRVRGKVFGRVRCYRAVGITPAYAGKSALRAGCHPSRWDHPRVCGEKLQDIS